MFCDGQSVAGKTGKIQSNFEKKSIEISKKSCFRNDSVKLCSAAAGSRSSVNTPGNFYQVVAKLGLNRALHFAHVRTENDGIKFFHHLSRTKRP